MDAALHIKGRRKILLGKDVRVCYLARHVHYSTTVWNGRVQGRDGRRDVPGVQADDYGRVLPREWGAGLRGMRRQSERADAERYARGVCARDAFRCGRSDCRVDCVLGVWN